MNRRENTSFTKTFAANNCLSGYNYTPLNCVVNTDNFTADVAKQTTKASVALSRSVFWLVHPVIWGQLYKTLNYILTTRFVVKW